MICAQCGAPTARMTCDACGQLAAVDRRYRLDRVLGRSTLSTSWVGRDLRTREAVVVEELPLPVGTSPSFADVVEAEVGALRGLDHPGVARVLDGFVLTMGGRPSAYTVHAWVEGWSLAEELTGALPLPEALAVLGEALDTVAWLHGRTPPVVHRDLHAGNLIRRADDRRLVLVDFSSVREAVRALPGSPDELPVPFAHLAPELFTGASPAPTVDLYGAGVLAVQLLTGREPRHLLRADGFLDWEDRVPDHPDLRLLLADLLQARPDRRASDAGEVREWVLALRSVLLEDA